MGEPSENKDKKFNGLWLLIALIIIPILLFLNARTSGNAGGNASTNTVGTAGGSTPSPTVTPTPPPTERENEVESRAPDSLDRLAEGPQIIETVFEATGKGSQAKFGGRASAKYFFTAYVKAESTIGSKRTTSRGNIEITETRKFLEVRDQLTLQDVDVSLALTETLPIDKVAVVANGIGALLTAIDPVVGGSVTAGVDATYGAIKAIDGTSLRGLLGKFGVDVPSNIESWASDLANQYTNNKLEDVHNKVHSIEGKTYNIVYLQTAKGAPMRVKFTNVDGSPIDDDEWDILKLANIFIDADVIPSRKARPGDQWEVDANTIAGLVDPVSQGGRCEGKLSVQRKADQENGDWTLQFLAAKVTTLSDRGTTAGVFRIQEGNAIGDKTNAFVKSMQLVGTGRLGKSQHKPLWILDFVTITSGDCEFRAIFSTNRKE